MTDEMDFILYRNINNSTDNKNEGSEGDKHNKIHIPTALSGKTISGLMSSFNNTNEVNHVWMLILGDLLSLILAFFILLYINITPSQKLWDNIVASVNLKYKVKELNEIEKRLEKHNPTLKIKGIKTAYIEQVISNHIKNYQGNFQANVFSKDHEVIISIPEKEIFLINDYVDDDAQQFLTFLASVLFNIERNILVRTYLPEDYSEDNNFAELKNKCLKIVKFLRNSTNMSNIVCEIKHMQNSNENVFEIIVEN